MLNKNKHRIIMVQILKDIYGDAQISSLLGFKGGSAAYFYYNLPRFSVDLDFDLLDITNENKEIILKKTRTLLKKYGTVKDARVKRWTIFLLLSYGDTDHNIKIEISTRVHKNQYELKNFFGIAMLVAKKETLFTNKLIALINRKKVAARDVYDIYFFANKLWDIDEDIIAFRTKKSTAEYLEDCVNTLKKIKERDILHGLGEVLEDKEKIWARKNLKKEAIFILRNYHDSINRN